MPSRNEQYLEAAINKSGTDGLPEPRTRNEKLLHRLVEEVSSGGLPEGGGSGSMTEDDALIVLADMSVVDPVTDTDGSVLIDGNGEIYSL